MSVKRKICYIYSVHVSFFLFSCITIKSVIFVVLIKVLKHEKVLFLYFKHPISTSVMEAKHCHSIFHTGVPILFLKLESFY